MGVAAVAGAGIKGTASGAGAVMGVTEEGCVSGHRSGRVCGAAGGGGAVCGAAGGSAASGHEGVPPGAFLALMSGGRRVGPESVRAARRRIFQSGDMGSGPEWAKDMGNESSYSLTEVNGGGLCEPGAKTDTPARDRMSVRASTHERPRGINAHLPVTHDKGGVEGHKGKDEAGGVGFGDVGGVGHSSGGGVRGVSQGSGGSRGISQGSSQGSQGGSSVGEWSGGSQGSSRGGGGASGGLAGAGVSGKRQTRAGAGAHGCGRLCDGDGMKGVMEDLALAFGSVTRAVGRGRAGSDRRVRGNVMLHCVWRMDLLALSSHGAVSSARACNPSGATHLVPQSFTTQPLSSFVSRRRQAHCWSVPCFDSRPSFKRTRGVVRQTP